MAIEIFKNDEDDILFGQDGNVFRVPYDFGNAFQNRMGLNNYINIPNISINMFDFSYLYWVNDAGTNNNIFSFESLSNSYSTYIYDSSAKISFTKNGMLSSNINLIVTGNNGASIGNNLIALRLNNDTAAITKNNNTTTLTPSINLITEQYAVKCILGAYSVSRNISTYNTHRINRFVVFNRYINQGELNYYYSNRLGSELQSTAGVEIDLHNDFAEILDFSTLQDGSDMRVGCRDYSGFIRHGEIMNLPAGTLQEKLAWANANLFVPFIS